MSKQPSQSQYIGASGAQTPSKSPPMQPKIPASVYVDQQGFLPGNVGAASVYVGGSPQAPRVVTGQQQQMGTSVYVQGGAPAAGGRPSAPGAASVYVGTSGAASVYIGAPRQTGTNVFSGSPTVATQVPPTSGQQVTSPVPSGTSFYMKAGGTQRPTPATESPPSSPKTSVGQGTTSFYMSSGAGATTSPPTTSSPSGGVNGASVYVQGGAPATGVYIGTSGQQQPTGTSVYVGSGAASAYIGAPRQTGTNVFSGSPTVATQVPPTSGQQVTSPVPSGTSFYMKAGGTQRPTPATESPPSSPKTSVGQGTTSFYMSSGAGATTSPPTTSGPSGGISGVSVYIGRQRTAVVSTEAPVQSSPPQNISGIPTTTDVKPAHGDVATTGAASPASEVSRESDKNEFTSKEVKPGPSHQNAYIGKVVEEDEDEATECPKAEEPSPVKRESDTHQATPSGNIFKKVTFSKEDEKAIRERQDQFGAPGHSGYVPLVRPAPPPAAATKLAPKAATEGRTSTKERSRSPTTLTPTRETPPQRPTSDREKKTVKTSGSPRTSAAERPKSTKSDGDVFHRAVSFHAKKPEPKKT